MPQGEILEQSRVSPPSGFLPPQSALPLTFFDLMWLSLPPVVERLFFYPYSHDQTHFMNTTLPNIKHSLSLTLQHYYPFAGTLTWLPQSTKPHINCDQGGVMLTVVESNLLDFNYLISNHPKDVNDVYPLVPQIHPCSTKDTPVEVPAMALQVTLFPNNGICIGISLLHAVADGKTWTSFMKSWASVCKSGLGDTSCLHPDSLPFYDRSVIHDPYNFEMFRLNKSATLGVSQQCFYKPGIRRIGETDKVRATFVLSRPEIQKLKGFVLDRFQGEKCHKHLSTFVLVTAYVWVCLSKVLACEEHTGGIEMEYFCFAIDSRERLNPPIPETYFGNCLTVCLVEVKRNDLIGDDGIAIAAEAIGSAIQKKISEGVLKDDANLVSKMKDVMFKPWTLSIAGSPKFGVYGIDFGWGRPKKVEVTSIETNGAISLSESSDGEGGIEIGLVLKKLEMDTFASIFTHTLKHIS